jgi:hypothetical protein
MTMFNVGARTEVIECRGRGGPTCMLQVALLNGAEPRTVDRP